LDRALDELTQAQSLAPTDIRIPLAIGSLYEDRQEPAKALETYQRAISLQPENPDAHFRAGLILKQLKAYSKAAQMLKRVVALRPKDSNALHQLAAVQALELVHGEKFQMAVPQ
jgi:tetratricopeptide (TPR) repeat protein